MRQLFRGLIFGGFLGLLTYQCQPVEKTLPVETVALIDTIISAPTKYYGIVIDSMAVSTGKIKWNQTLSVLLEDFNVPGEKVYKIARASREVYDVRKLKAGKEYSIIHTNDSLQTAQQFIFEPDPRSYVIYHLGDSVFAELHQRDVQIHEKSISVEIKSSVYLDITEAGAPPSLVDHLVDILAWQVTFQHVQAGDKMKVIYEEESIEGVPVGIAKIIGVYFHHFDKEFYGIHYDAGGNVDYYDEDGNSLRKAFLKSPLQSYRISSRYSGRRYHPVQKRYKAHLGTDFAAPRGTKIRSVGDGIVMEAKYGKYNGNYVKIKHNSNYTTQYLHMQKIKSGIRPGVRVSQGQTIGFVGSTGLANGPHVCFRFWKNGRQVDALKVNLPPSEPINPSHLDYFLHQKNAVMHRLDNMEFETDYKALTSVAAQP